MVTLEHPANARFIGLKTEAGYARLIDLLKNEGYIPVMDATGFALTGVDAYVTEYDNGIVGEFCPLEDLVDVDVSFLEEEEEEV